MAKLPDRSMIRKIMTILEYADSNTPSTPKDLSAEIYKGRRVEFSYYKPSINQRRRLGYSEPRSIVGKIYFAIALKVLNEDCTLAFPRKDFSSEHKASLLFSENSRDLLNSRKIDIGTILDRSTELLARNPPVLPTAMKLYAECKPDDLPFKWFRYCLSILVFEPKGRLGASARRIYMPRGGEHQTPGEIGS